MAVNDDVAVIRGRLTKAQAELEGWKASRIQEQYLEAHSLVEALELLLEHRARPANEPRLESNPGMAGAGDLLAMHRRLQDDKTGCLNDAISDGCFRLGVSPRD